MSLTRVVWFEFYVVNVARAQHFYGDAFGWRLEPFEAYDPENYFLVRTGDGRSGSGAIVRRDSVPGLEHTGSGQVVVYLEVLDLEATLLAVDRAGGRVLSRRRAIGDDDGYFALVTDPEGNVIGLWSAQ